MPSDHISRADALAVVEKLWNHDRESFSDVNYCDVEGHILAIPAALDSLPAAEDDGRLQREYAELVRCCREMLGNEGELNVDPIGEFITELDANGFIADTAAPSPPAAEGAK